ncbi:MAG: hypothetical protein M3Y65_16340 [Pseudomonadota bacterium]|nr:hypothetical protein [Pseudomonadota bacterium]
MKLKTESTPGTPFADGLPQIVNAQFSSPVETRVIPNPPGGGSWTWDPTAWEWVDNFPAPETAVTTPE